MIAAIAEDLSSVRVETIRAVFWFDYVCTAEGYELKDNRAEGPRPLEPTAQEWADARLYAFRALWSEKRTEKHSILIYQSRMRPVMV